jgi:DNA-binding transcriptional ArsR family regulator
MEVISEPGPARALLHPMRRRMLEILAEPASAASLARALELPRQRVNYHLRTLDDLGFLELIEEKKIGNCTERIFRARSRSYVIAPQTLGVLGARISDVENKFSAAYLLAVASQLVRDMTSLREDAGEKKIATLTIEADVAFADPAARSRFAAELADAVSALVARHHTEGGRRFRLVVAAHPQARENKHP